MASSSTTPRVGGAETVPSRHHLIRDGFAAQFPDADPEETQEWLDSFDAMVEAGGQQRARYLMLRLLGRAGERHVGLPALTTTDYINTIPTESEPFFPGDEEIERRYRNWIRWNAAMMVHRAQRPGVGVGGHISTYASSASLYEVGYNHFFRGKNHPGGGDHVFFQGHASPGMYARAFLEGRLSTDTLDGFRQEVSHPGGGSAVLSAPPVDAGLLGAPDGVHGTRADECHRPGQGQPLSAPPRHQGHLPTACLGVSRRRRAGRGRITRPDPPAGHRRAGQPHLRHQLQSAAPRRSGPRQRQDHPGAGVVLPGRRLERHQGGLGPRVGCAAARRQGRRPGEPDEHHAGRRLPDLQGQRRRLRA